MTTAPRIRWSQVLIWLTAGGLAAVSASAALALIVVNAQLNAGLARSRVVFWHETGEDGRPELKSQETPEPLGFRKMPASFVNAIVASEGKRMAAFLGHSLTAQGRLWPGILEDLHDLVGEGLVDLRLSHEQIVELYVNRAYLGTVGGQEVYGAATAAKAYFGLTLNELNLSEDALLGALFKGPDRYSPYERPKDAEARRRYVLTKMVRDGFLSQAQADQATAIAPRLKAEGPPGK